MPDVAYQELAGLWEAVFGDKPSVIADLSLTTRILVTCLPPTEPHSFTTQADEDSL